VTGGSAGIDRLGGFVWADLNNDVRETEAAFSILRCDKLFSAAQINRPGKGRASLHITLLSVPPAVPPPWRYCRSRAKFSPSVFFSLPCRSAVGARAPAPFLRCSLGLALVCADFLARFHDCSNCAPHGAVQRGIQPVSNLVRTPGFTAKLWRKCWGE
jgi:hypothetical protein